MRIDMQDTPFNGRTSSVPWSAAPPPLDCTRCGSSLAGRREAIRQETTKGIRFVTETFRCRCGRGRHVKREVAA